MALTTIMASTTTMTSTSRNDFCPSLRLASRDVVCVREGYSLEKYIPQVIQRVDQWDI